MVKIIGAGIAGLLAARMLQHRDPVVHESQKELPNNHSAVLRFRSPVIGELIGAPFKRVRVLKSVANWRNPVADAMAYSEKCLGHYRTDRSYSHKTEVVERWVAPPDFIERLSKGVAIEYGAPFDFSSEKQKVISTIPMPALMAALKYEGQRPNFSYQQGVNVIAELPEGSEAFLSLYTPNPRHPFYRISVTGREMVAECAIKQNLDLASYTNVAYAAAELIGVETKDLSEIRQKRMAYSKIAPVEDRERKEFIHWASSVTGRAFSLGRFATWRPGLLADDLVQDIRLIDSWIDSGSGYAMDMHRIGRTSK